MLVPGKCSAQLINLEIFFSHHTSFFLGLLFTESMAPQEDSFGWNWLVTSYGSQVVTNQRFTDKAPKKLEKKYKFFVQKFLFWKKVQLKCWNCTCGLTLSLGHRNSAKIIEFS